MAGFKVTGLDKLQKKLKEKYSLDDVKELVAYHGDKLNERMKAETEKAFVKGYSEGDLAGSINTNIKDDGFTAEVGPTMDYAGYVEYGTRFMEAEPYIKPAFTVQKELFKKDMKRLIK